MSVARPVGCGSRGISGRIYGIKAFANHAVDLFLLLLILQTDLQPRQQPLTRRLRILRFRQGQPNLFGRDAGQVAPTQDCQDRLPQRFELRSIRRRHGVDRRTDKRVRVRSSCEQR